MTAPIWMSVGELSPVSAMKALMTLQVKCGARVTRDFAFLTTISANSLTITNAMCIYTHSVFSFMNLNIPNTNRVIKVNHPNLVTPAPTSPLPKPKLVITEKRKKA